MNQIDGEILPDIIWKSVFDELFILELVETQESCVITKLKPCLEVDNYIAFAIEKAFKIVEIVRIRIANLGF